MYATLRCELLNLGGRRAGGRQAYIALVFRSGVVFSQLVRSLSFGLPYDYSRCKCSLLAVGGYDRNVTDVEPSKHRVNYHNIISE